MRGTAVAIGTGLLLCAIALRAGEPEWNPANIKECDRACLGAIMQRYMDAIYEHDSKAVAARLKLDRGRIQEIEQL